MNEPDYLEGARSALLAAALAEAPFSGWSLVLLQRAGEAAGIDRAKRRLAFPRGVIDLITYYSIAADRAMEDGLKAYDLSGLKVRERIALAVRLRLEALMTNKEAARRAAQLLALPLHAATGAELIARTADTIWRAIGDTSTDFNFYSKRALLAAVYGATLMRFLSDVSEEHAETWAFLDRRIDEVMQIEKAKGAARKALSALPSPLALASALRYGPRRR